MKRVKFITFAETEVKFINFVEIGRNMQYASLALGMDASDKLNLEVSSKEIHLHLFTIKNCQECNIYDYKHSTITSFYRKYSNPSVY